MPSLADRVVGSYWHVVRVTAERELLLRIRYPANAAGMFVPFLLFFVAIFVGGSAVAGQAMSDSLGGIIVGYFLWTLSTVSFVDISQAIAREAQWGTLERHFVTPHGFGVVLLTKAVMTILFTLLLSTVLLGFMLVLTGHSLQIDLLTVGPIVFFAVASVFGTGFAFSGVTVLYKQTGNWLSVFNFVLLGLVAAPASDIALLRILPLVQGSDMLQQAMTEGVRLWEFGAASLVLLLVVGTVYPAVGYLVFRRCERRARELGVLGDY